ELDEVERPERPDRDRQPSIEHVASEATLDRMVFDGGVFDTPTMPLDADEDEFLGIPGLLDADEVADLLRERRRKTPGPAAAAAPATTAASVSALRSELNTCARAYARQRGITPAAAHGEARRATGGPPAAQADAATLQARIEVLRKRAVGR
ncbi:MAG: ATP-dependent helicase, partial [Candidatus Nanopelagicales bacterium]